MTTLPVEGGTEQQSADREVPGSAAAARPAEELHPGDVRLAAGGGPVGREGGRRRQLRCEGARRAGRARRSSRAASDPAVRPRRAAPSSTRRRCGTRRPRREGARGCGVRRHRERRRGRGHERAGREPNAARRRARDLRTRLPEPAWSLGEAAGVVDDVSRSSSTVPRESGPTSRRRDDDHDLGVHARYALRPDLRQRARAPGRLPVAHGRRRVRANSVRVGRVMPPP